MTRDQFVNVWMSPGPLLNVAVSRAKDSFIVFGHPEVFGVGNAGAPSAILRKELLEASDEPFKQVRSSTFAPASVV